MTDPKNALLEHDPHEEMRARLRTHGYFAMSKPNRETGVMIHRVTDALMMFILCAIIPVDIVALIVMLILPASLMMAPFIVMLVTGLPLILVRPFYAEFIEHGGGWQIRATLAKDDERLLRLAQTLADETRKNVEIEHLGP